MLHQYGSRTLFKLSAIALATLSSCAPLKFYPGEERPDSSISRLLFNSTGATLVDVSIDGTPHPHPGRTVELLPGAHTVTVKYQERFDGADVAAGMEPKASSDQSSLVMTKTGTCQLKFSIEATQELFLYVDAGSNPVFGSAVPPTITLKEEGFNKPALYQERCKEAGKTPPGKAAS